MWVLVLDRDKVGLCRRETALLSRVILRQRGPGPGGELALVLLNRRERVLRGPSLVSAALLVGENQQCHVAHK